MPSRSLNHKAVHLFVRRLVALVVLVPLLGAANAASILGTPTVIVYPFTLNGGDVQKEAGSRLAVAVANRMAELGNIKVEQAEPGITRTGYLAAALRRHADYYVAGFLTPLGDGVSVVEQLVSTTTGIVVFSNSAQLRTYEDAASQGDLLHDALLAHQGRNLGAYAAPPPPVPSPSQTPESGTSANLGKLFGRHRKAARAATPSPSPAALVRAATPSLSAAAVAAAPRMEGFGLLPVGGSAAGERRDFTGAALRNVLQANRQRVAEAAGRSTTACTQAGVGTLLGANVATRSAGGRGSTAATLELLAYDCDGSVIYRRTFAGAPSSDWKVAVDRAVRSAVTALLAQQGVRPS